MAKKNGPKNPANVRREPLSSPERIVTKSPAFFSAYTNDMQVSVSPWDIRIVFGELGDLEGSVDKPRLNIKQIGEVRMSVQIAKRLAMMLMENLQNYETAMGPIPLGPGEALPPIVSQPPS
jgi:hypothetical protein